MSADRTAAAVEPSGAAPTATPSAPTRAAGGPTSSRGELGSLPIIVGLIVIAIVFQIAERPLPHRGQLRQPDRPDRRRTRSSPWASSFVLLLGEIDLSVGFVSGVGGVLTALLLMPDGNELPTVARDRASRSSPALGDRRRCTG